jgi:subtilisin
MKVVSLSLAGNEYSQALHDAVDDATAHGVLIVAAAGNTWGGPVEYPANYTSVLAVASVDGQYNHSLFSSTGNELGISAPGENINSTYPHASYHTSSGTSMATPHVAGVAALVYSAHPDWTNEQVKKQIIDTATPLGDPRLFGAGFVNAIAAVGVGNPS